MLRFGIDRGIIKLESLKKIGEADAVVGIDGDSMYDKPLLVICNQDRNKSYPFRQMNVRARKSKNLRGKNILAIYSKRSFGSLKLGANRKYFWAASESVLAKYSNDIVTFILNLAPNDAEAARNDHREFFSDR